MCYDCTGDERDDGADSFMSVAHRAELLRYLFGGPWGKLRRSCCDHCNNLEGDPAGHDYGDYAHDRPCARCEAEQAE